MSELISDYKHFLQESILNKNRILITEADETELDKDKFQKQMQWLFPSIWNEIKGSVQMAIPIASTTRLTQEEKIFKQYVNNIDIEVRLNSHTMRNAWTYPFIQSRGAATLASLTGWLGILYQLISACTIIEKNKTLFTKVEVDSSGIIQFPDIPVHFLSFITKGLYTDLNERETVAILLHEIGHWIKHIPIVSMLTYEAMKPFFSAVPPLAFALVILIIIQARKAEYEADKFVKECGFAKELASGLTRVTSTVRPDVSFWVKISDFLGKIFTLIHNIVDKYLPITSHPSLPKRISALEIKEQFILEQAVPERILLILKSKCNELDRVLAPKLQALFPMK
jgi:Zn-dependent protease with chaperone function